MIESSCNQKLNRMPLGWQKILRSVGDQLKDIIILFNSFAANVTDRQRHSRLPTSPIGDLDTHYLEGMQRHT